jgi:hypothetical protein
MTSVKQVHQVSGLPTFSRGTHIFSRATTKPIVVAQHLPVRRGYIVVVHQLVGAARLIHVWVSLFLLVLAPASLQLRPQAEPLQGGRCARRMHIHQRLHLDLLREMILKPLLQQEHNYNRVFDNRENILMELSIILFCVL